MLIQSRSIRWLVSGDRRASPANIVLTELRTLWTADTVLHFQEEEDILIPFCTRHDGTFHPLSRQIANEHAWLRGHIDLLTVDDIDGLAEFGRCLHDHVRFEERVVFEHIQSTLSAGEIAQLGAQLRQFRLQHRPPRTRRGRRSKPDQNSGT
jgi:iron-sulfur cluster repair protein YtfE (RIC family)